MAIVEQAIKDYKVAYRSKNSAEIMFLERFFYSEYYELMTGGKVDADKILKLIRKDIDADGEIRIIKRRKENGR